MDQAEDTGRMTLEQMIDGYADTQYVALAAHLGIADLLADGPLSADDLATATNSHPDALFARSRRWQPAVSSLNRMAGALRSRRSPRS